MSWLIVVLVLTILVFVLYVVPFVLIIRWYNNSVRKQFEAICRELNLPPKALTIYRNGAFVYPAIHGRYNGNDFSLTSEAGASFRFTAGKARASGRQVVTKLVFRTNRTTGDKVISLLRKPSGRSPKFSDCFRVDASGVNNLSPDTEKSLMECAELFGNRFFPIQIHDGSIIIQMNDMIWTRRKREMAMRAIQLARVISTNI